MATSASRDAENRDEFVRGVFDILGVEPEVISGDQEAEFSFTGATKELKGRADLARPYLVVDIGGGSTEFVVGDEHVRGARSVDIGCVRLTERHLVRDGVVSDPRGRSRSPRSAPTSRPRWTSPSGTSPCGRRTPWSGSPVR